MGMALRGTLRLEPLSSRGTSRKSAVGDETGGGGGDANYYNKLITLFPAEALTLYGTGVAVFGRSTLAALLVCLAILIILRWIATQPPEGGAPHYEAIIVAAISFLLWTTATDPKWAADIKQFNLPVKDIQKWAAFIGAAFVLIAPAVIRPPAQPNSTSSDEAMGAA